MESKILILCPTRGRPNNVIRLRESLYHHASGVDSFDFMFCVDKDDPKLADYLLDGQHAGHYYATGEPKRLGPWLNHFVVNGAVHENDYDIIGFLGDDVVARTYGWNDMIREAMVPNGMVYGNDGW